MNLWRNRSQLSEQCEYVVPVVIQLNGTRQAERSVRTHEESFMD